eukprot:1048196-Pelagomonas_calceolata.AAC.9
MNAASASKHNHTRTALDWRCAAAGRRYVQLGQQYYPLSRARLGPEPHLAGATGQQDSRGEGLQSEGKEWRRVPLRQREDV